MSYRVSLDPGYVQDGDEYYLLEAKNDLKKLLQE